MEKNAVFQAGDTLQMDSRPAPASALRSMRFSPPQWAQISVSQLSMFGRSPFRYAVSPVPKASAGGRRTPCVSPLCVLHVDVRHQLFRLREGAVVGEADGGLDGLDALRFYRRQLGFAGDAAV